MVAISVPLAERGVPTFVPRTAAGLDEIGRPWRERLRWWTLNGKYQVEPVELEDCKNFAWFEIEIKSAHCNQALEVLLWQAVIYRMNLGHGFLANSSGLPSSLSLAILWWQESVVLRFQISTTSQNHNPAAFELEEPLCATGAWLSGILAVGGAARYPTEGPRYGA